MNTQCLLKLKSQNQPQSYIFNTANITGRLTFLLVFARLEIHKKSTKNKGFQFDVTEVDIYWSKIHETESKCKFNLYFHRYSEGVVNPLNASVALI